MNAEEHKQSMALSAEELSERLENMGKDSEKLTITYFDSHANQLPQQEVTSIGQAKSIGRKNDARGFRTQVKTGDKWEWVHYIRPFPNKGFVGVNPEGFEAFFNMILHREERRQNIQLKRAMTDPAYQTKDTDGHD